MYPDIDYINEITFFVHELSYIIRKRKKLNIDCVQQMLSHTISLLNILETYLDDHTEF